MYPFPIQSINFFSKPLLWHTSICESVRKNELNVLILNSCDRHIYDEVTPHQCTSYINNKDISFFDPTMHANCGYGWIHLCWMNPHLYCLLRLRMKTSYITMPQNKHLNKLCFFGLLLFSLVNVSILVIILQIEVSIPMVILQFYMLMNKQIDTLFIINPTLAILCSLMCSSSYLMTCEDTPTSCLQPSLCTSNRIYPLPRDTHTPKK